MTLSEFGGFFKVIYMNFHALTIYLKKMFLLTPFFFLGNLILTSIYGWMAAAISTVVIVFEVTQILICEVSNIKDFEEVFIS